MKDGVLYIVPAPGDPIEIGEIVDVATIHERVADIFAANTIETLIFDSVSFDIVKLDARNVFKKFGEATESLAEAVKKMTASINRIEFPVDFNQEALNAYLDAQRPVPRPQLFPNDRHRIASSRGAYRR